MEYTLVENILEGELVLTNIKAVNEAGDVLFIPIDEGNVDYQAYLASLKEKK
jgi:ethanolamine utilization protein EutQ (cupin superfamily)